MIKFYRQQTFRFIHHNRLMLKKFSYFIVLAILFSTLSGCSWFYKGKYSTPVLLPTEVATKEQLLNEINRFAKVGSMNAKMDLKFEDTSFAEKGSKIIYTEVNGTVVVQRPANIFLRVDFAGFDIAQMTSNGENFRVAVLKGGKCGDKCKKFILGTNDADYSKLENDLKNSKSANTEELSSFSNLRPQHFTDAILIRPVDSANTYLTSTIYQTEDIDKQKKVMRGYYLLDELLRDKNGNMKISRRFWFDRVGGIHLTRQQIFDKSGEIESDIVYGKEGNLTTSSDFTNLPLQIEVTRPKEKYTMKLKYQSPESVQIGKVYPAKAFVLENSWGLEEVNLDEKLKKATAQNSAITNQ